jgi:cell division inhibitor SepF
MPGLVQKIKDLWTPPDDEYDYELESDNVHDRTYKTEGNSLKDASNINKKESKVVNIHTTAQLQVVLFKPESFGEETRTIADELAKMHTVVLNMENTQKDALRRILDFLSGVAYANGGQIKRVSTDTFIITPYNVDITGDDLLDELENNGVYF